MHSFKCTVWKSPANIFHCGFVHPENLKRGENQWWVLARILGMSLTDYILLLKNTFNATGFSYTKEKNFLWYYWEKESDAERYKNWINSMIKKANLS